MNRLIGSNIVKDEKFNDDKKEFLYNTLVDGFGQIKEDIWLIFYSILIVVYFAIVKEITNPFGWKVEQWKIPETVNLTLFISTTLAMWDIMQTLFNLAEINLLLNKNK